MRNRKGFTLIELMIVLAIIGILAVMAIPRFMRSATKSKQSEAKLILKQIYINQRAYRQQALINEYYDPGVPASAANKFALSEIWVEIPDNAKYVYTLDVTQNTFVATATGNIDDDPTQDVWTIDHQGLLTNLPGNNDVLD